jgi:hypothetical protein
MFSFFFFFNFVLRSHWLSPTIAVAIVSEVKIQVGCRSGLILGHHISTRMQGSKQCTNLLLNLVLVCRTHKRNYMHRVLLRNYMLGGMCFGKRVHLNMFYIFTTENSTNRQILLKRNFPAFVPDWKSSICFWFSLWSGLPDHTLRKSFEPVILEYIKSPIKSCYIGNPW